jgi:hypothetical protein
MARSSAAMPSFLRWSLTSTSICVVRTSTWPASSRMTSSATSRSASIVQNVCLSACAVRRSSRTPARAACLVTTSPTALAEIAFPIRRSG